MWLPLVTIGVLLGALALWLNGAADRAHDFSMAALVLLAAPLLLQTVRKALQGDFATDAAAALAIITAVLLGQPIPGLIIVLMQSGGEALEEYAQRRASNALHELEASAPRIAHLQQGESYQDVEVSTLKVADIILIRPGEAVPADGDVIDGNSHVDTSTITGEPIPVRAGPGTHLFSGTINQHGALRLRVTATAAASQYERIVELVRAALAEKAPIERLADRYAVWFTPLTLVTAAAAYLLSGDAERVLAVLVVATPCPLILATPVAIIGGMNRAARSGFLFRSGAAIEQLAMVRAVVFDKTGTLTTGRPHAARMVSLDPAQRSFLLRGVGAVELGSGHSLAREVVAFARQSGATFELAAQVEDIPGSGVMGQFEGHEIALGSEEFIAALAPGNRAAMPATSTAELRSYIAVDGRIAGYFAFEDEVRPDLASLFARLRQLGITHFVILSGDDAATVAAVAALVGVQEAHGDLAPQDKVEHVKRIQAQYGSTLMIGDGTNDAPALAAADVGIAVAERGGGITAETADVVLLGQDLVRIGEGVGIARHALRIAKQSIRVGLGLSLIAMVAAALGYVPPIAGALYQEAVDVAVILNALRAAGPAR